MVVAGSQLGNWALKMKLDHHQRLIRTLKKIGFDNMGHGYVLRNQCIGIMIFNVDIKADGTYTVYTYISYQSEIDFNTNVPLFPFCLFGFCGDRYCHYTPYLFHRLMTFEMTMRALSFYVSKLTNHGHSNHY